MDAPESQKALLRATIAQSVSAGADGEQLVRVAATTLRPDLSFRLSQATIDAYIETVINNNARQNDEAVEFFQGQVDAANAAYQAAQAKVNDFLIQRNVGTGDDLSVSDQLLLDSLARRPRPQGVAVRDAAVVARHGPAARRVEPHGDRAAPPPHRPAGAAGGAAAPSQGAQC